MKKRIIQGSICEAGNPKIWGSRKWEIVKKEKEKRKTSGSEAYEVLYRKQPSIKSKHRVKDIIHNACILEAFSMPEQRDDKIYWKKLKKIVEKKAESPGHEYYKVERRENLLD